MLPFSSSFSLCQWHGIGIFFFSWAESLFCSDEGCKKAAIRSSYMVSQYELHILCTSFDSHHAREATAFQEFFAILDTSSVPWAGKRFQEEEEGECFTLGFRKLYSSRLNYGKPADSFAWVCVGIPGP